jgi:hypothetical protein
MTALAIAAAFLAVAWAVLVVVAQVPAGRPAGAATGLLRGLAGYAGLCQRVFVGLLVAWTLLVALGLLAS